MQVIGIDPGTKRVGVAVGNTDVGVATAYEVWPRQGVVERLRACVDEWEAGRVVVGLPRSLDGSEGPAAAAARELLAEFRSSLDVDVELHDERFSTVAAQTHLHAGGLDTRRSRKVIDAVAAAVILQSWFDAHAEPAR